MNGEFQTAIIPEEPVIPKTKEIYPIDSDGYVDWESGLHRLEAYDYQCQENEIDVSITESFIKARWDGKEWVEGGEPREPIQRIPTQDERIDAIENALLEMVLGGNA